MKDKVIIALMSMAVCALAFVGTLQSADTKVTAMTAVTSFEDNDVLYVVRPGTGDRKITAANMKTDIAAATMSFTNKTLDANGTGNTLKGTGEIQILASAFRRKGAGVTNPSTTNTDFNYGLPKFSNSTDVATNWVDYVINVPADIDTSVALTAVLTFYLGGADTGDHDYVLSMCNPAGSAAAACTPGNDISLAFTADGSGADGDVEYTTSTTLTGWAAALTAGRQWLIRLARDGDDGTNDTSTVDSYPQVISIKYGYTN